MVTIMLNQACGSQGTNTENSKNGIQEKHEITEISYQATTRGFYQMLWIGNTTLTLTNDRSHNEKTVYPITENDWNELMTVLKDVDVSTLPGLEAPTSKRHHDAAAFATLTVVQDGKEIKTQNFDHGHPPKHIEALVSKILLLADRTHKKQ